jgi:hypothetical protein
LGVAFSDQGRGFLEVNFRADLNLAQLADGKGVLDHGYTEHLRGCGFPDLTIRNPFAERTRRSQVRPAQPGA